jgi:hypothetical protein
MSSIRRFALAALLPAIVALVPGSAAAASATTAATGVAQDTTFKPDGSYTLDVAVGGQALTMTFVVEKKTDGSFVGVFKHAEMGEFATTSFKVEGRKMSMGIVTPGGPATVTLMVNKENVVDGEWAMEGDGSKISGKKAS